MKALTLIAPSTFEFGEAPTPAPAKGEVLVTVKACGICGSDLHGNGRTQRAPYPADHHGPRSRWRNHRSGRRRDGLETSASAVTFDSTEYCGECEKCKTGYINLCTNRKVLGVFLQ